MSTLLKNEVKRSLKKNNRWKAFIKGNKIHLKDATLVNLNITTMEQEDVGVFFDVSIVYRLVDGKQKQSYESGLAKVSKDKKVKKLQPEYMQQRQLWLL
jgi:hypothetical protein